MAVLVTLSASLSFVAPLEPACLLVYAPGKYRFGDFIRAGVPLTLLASLANLAARYWLVLPSTLFTLCLLAVVLVADGVARTRFLIGPIPGSNVRQELSEVGRPGRRALNPRVAVGGHGEAAMLAASAAHRPRPMMDHSKPVRVASPERIPVTLGRR